MTYLFLSALSLTIGCGDDEASQVLINSGDYNLDDIYIPANSDDIPIPAGGKYSQLMAAAEASGDDATILILETAGSILAVPFTIDAEGSTFGFGSSDDATADLTEVELAEKAEEDWEVACDTKVTSNPLQSFSFADGSLSLGAITLDDPLLYASVEADDCASVESSVDEVAIKEASKDDGYILYMSKAE